MIFHSLDFLGFFVVVLSLYWLLRRRSHQNLLLLLSSYFFYGYIHPWFCILLATTTITDFCCARAMARHPAHKRVYLILSLIASLTILGFFKYFGFFVENISLLLEAAGMGSWNNTLAIFLPVGISFYTFQSISYVVDVYRGTIPPARKLIDYALYVSFFPQLVAGPIERSTQLLPQMQQSRHFDYPAAHSAIILILWGFFKKLVIADNVALTCNKIFALENPDFALLWVGVFAFCIQIFADFSAYTDIARGSAVLLGFRLMENFHHPYLSRSPAEFWQRWHISLSTWFRDYVYIPLGGSHCSAYRSAWNVLVTFFLSGLWHGAQWNFVLWGLWYGVLIVVYRLFAAIVPDHIRCSLWCAPFQWALMFAFVHIGWLLFRETDFEYLQFYFTLSPRDVHPEELAKAAYLFYTTLLISLPIWLHHLTGVLPPRCATAFSHYPRALVAAQLVAGVVLFSAILLFRSEMTSDFIYFQF